MIWLLPASTWAPQRSLGRKYWEQGILCLQPQCSQDRGGGLGVPRRRPAQLFPDIWANVQGEGELGVCVHRGGGASVRGGRGWFEHLFQSFLKLPEALQGSKLRAEKDESLGINHYQFTEGRK